MTQLDVTVINGHPGGCVVPGSPKSESAAAAMKTPIGAQS